MRPRRSPAPTCRSTAAGRRSSRGFVRAQEDQPRAAGWRRARRLHLGRARRPASRTIASRSKVSPAPRPAPSTPSWSPMAWRAAVRRRPASALPISGAPRASMASCPRCSAPSSTGCSRSCRWKARRCRAGSTRCRASGRPMTSTRSTSIRSRTWSSASSISTRCAHFLGHRCSCRRPMSTPAACVSFHATRSPPMW